MSESVNSPCLIISAQEAVVYGDWTLANYAQISSNVSVALKSEPPITRCDLTALGDLDTAGASLLVELMGSDLTRSIRDQKTSLSVERQALLERVRLSLIQEPAIAAPTEHPVLTQLLGRIGAATERFYQKSGAIIGFMGLILETLVRNLAHPRRWRLTSVVAQIEDTGLNAVPIVALLTFMVGAVIAFLGATILADFGASIYTVNLVAFSFLREFAVLLTAILMAGRTASAFTAQIGSMKANEEVDALRAQGLSPVELLVIPRVLALLISLPLLTFVGMIAGMAGGAGVCALALDISPTLFIAIDRKSTRLNSSH